MQGIDVLYRNLNAAKIADAKAAGLLTGAWTVNPADIPAFRAMKVNYITVNR